MNQLCSKQQLLCALTCMLLIAYFIHHQLRQSFNFMPRILYGIYIGKRLLQAYADKSTTKIKKNVKKKNVTASAPKTWSQGSGCLNFALLILQGADQTVNTGNRLGAVEARGVGSDRLRNEQVALSPPQTGAGAGAGASGMAEIL